MGVIICQDCGTLVTFYQAEKVAKRYGICQHCTQKKKTK